MGVRTASAILDRGDYYDVILAQYTAKVQRQVATTNTRGASDWATANLILLRFEELVHRAAQRMSPTEWLLALRDARLWIEGAHPGFVDGVEVLDIATAASALATGPDIGFDPDEPDMTAVDAVVDLVEASAWLARLQNVARLVGVGAKLDLSSGVPNVNATAAQRRSVERRIHRLRAVDLIGARGSQFVPALGQVPTVSATAFPVYSAAGFAVAFDLSMFTALTEAEIPEAVRWHADLLNAVAILVASPAIAMSQCSMTFLHWGCLWIARDELLSALGDACSRLTADRLGGLIPSGVTIPDPDDVLTALSDLSRVSLFPVAGTPAIRIDGDECLVDVHAATLALHRALAPVGLSKHYLKPWARHAESQMQGAIDLTSWSPKGEIRDLIGAEVHASGSKNAITDLDAIAVHDDVILLVDCKAVLLDEHLDRCDPSSVGNMRSRVEGDLEKWRKRLATIRANPNLAEFNFSGRKLIGVVAYTFAPWVPDGVGDLEVLPGLREASTLAEVYDWLLAN